METQAIKINDRVRVQSISSNPATLHGKTGWIREISAFTGFVQMSFDDQRLDSRYSRRLFDANELAAV